MFYPEDNEYLVDRETMVLVQPLEAASVVLSSAFKPGQLPES